MNEEVGILLHHKLRADIEAKSKKRLKHRSDFLEFCDELQEATAQRLSDTTLRRFWGYQEEGKHTASIRTLDVLCAYLGYKDWDEYAKMNMHTTSDAAAPQAEAAESATAEEAADASTGNEEPPVSLEESASLHDDSDAPTIKTEVTSGGVAGGGTEKGWSRWKRMSIAAVLLAVAVSTLIGLQSSNFVVGEITYRVESYVKGRAVIAECSPDAAGSLKLPDVVTHFGRSYTVVGVDDDAFFNRREIVELYLPRAIEWIGKRAFKCCDHITTLHMSDEVRTMGDEAMRSCYLLKDVRLSASLRELPEYCFSGDSVALTSITLPDSILTIGRDAFGKCCELRLIHLPKSLQRIERGAFWECHNLERVSFPASLTTLGPVMFWHCERLTRIDCAAPVPPQAENLFEVDKSSQLLLTVPPGSVTKYRATKPWSKFVIEEKG